MSSDAAKQRLRPSDFYFHGFELLQSALKEFLNDVWIRISDPVALGVEDAVFVPSFAVARAHYEGCLVTADGKPIPTALSQRRYGAFGNQVLGTLSQPIPIKPERVVEEEVVYLGWFIDHFGHLLLESLARTWILRELDPTTKVLFHINGPKDFSTIATRILEAFGIPAERILMLDEQAVLRRVIVPEALYEISYAAHVRAPEAYRDAAAAIVGAGDRSDQPVYLSRRLLSSRQRPIVGEFELEEVFRENGFLIVHPELMTFDDQVRLVNRHHDIFTSAGSAAYLPLFALQPPRLHTLTAGIPLHDYFLVPRILGAEAFFCNCFTGDNRPSDYYLPPVLEMSKLADYLESRGLLKNRLRASLTAQAKDFQPDYEELRLFAYVQFLGFHGKQLPTEVEAEALTRARTSWPLCWMLARYYVVRDPARIDELVQWFNALAEAESDIGRLANFHPDIRVGIGKIDRNCHPQTRLRLASVLKDRFLINLSEEKKRRQMRRGTHQGAAGGPANDRESTSSPVPAARE